MSRTTAETETVSAIGWAPIRQTEGRLWISIKEIGCIQDIAKLNVRRTEELIPSWSEENPVVAYRRVRIVTEE